MMLLQAKNDIEELAGENKEVKEELEESANRVNHLSGENEELLNAVKELTIENKSISSVNDDYAKKVKSALEKIGSLEKDLESERNKVNELEARKSENKVPSEGNYDSWQEVDVKATAYTAYCDGCSGTTYTGIDLRENPNAKVIAVDPNIIPLGSTVYVEGYGEAIAGDTGGAIKGNRIDVFIADKSEAVAWGVKDTKVLVNVN